MTIPVSQGAKTRCCDSTCRTVVLPCTLNPLTSRIPALLFAFLIIQGTAAFCVLSAEDAAAKDHFDYADLDDPVHAYWTKPLHDPFTSFLKELKAGTVKLDRSSELAFVKSLLRALNISEHSQMLVFSTTSLQLRFISQRNPRAVFFNQSIYLGYIPGGRIEIISLDPELGGIFYIFDIPKENRPIAPDRSDKCMHCHAKASIGNVPGLVIKSVLPGQRGGSIDSFRRAETGHQIPFSERYGGWHVTGKHSIKEHWGNKIGTLFKGKISTTGNLPGQHFDLARYPAKTSDILAHLLAEHQAGFVDRVIECTYRARAYRKAGGNKLRPEHREILKSQAAGLVRYILFADEAKIPPPGIGGDPSLKDDFLSAARYDRSGRSLRDFDLKDHIFKYRCSYMIHSPVFRGMPDWFRKEVYHQLKNALRSGPASRDFTYLTPAEKKAIAEILIATVEDPLFHEKQ